MIAGTIIVIGTLVVLVACASTSGDDEKAAGTVATSEATTEGESTTTEETVVADPKANYRSNCDMLLGDFNSNYEFEAHVVGDARIHNTGNVGVVINVRAHWDQAGEGPITMKERVRVPIDGRKVVHFKKSIDQSEIEKVQSANYRCGVKAKIVDTFGEAQED